ncbi:MAG TPA: hypothetical protein PKW79_04205, partial [Rhabdochlamydiaceae bacterium]|nr:hypothetical protein [Rhabdochlamydiaceae bacterium]
QGARLPHPKNSLHQASPLGEEPHSLEKCDSSRKSKPTPPGWLRGSGMGWWCVRFRQHHPASS